MKHAHTMPFGATLLPAGGVSFALWAPAAKEARLHLAHAQAKPGTAPTAVAAQPANGGWWTCHVPHAGAGSRYQWQTDGGPLMPDPASRCNPGGPHEPSLVTDPRVFEWEGGWTGRPWHEVVLYEMHVGAFTPEGTFRAAQDELPRLAGLGITAVELMPVASFPGERGWGYDGVLTFAPHAAYGSPDDLKSFIQAAHGLGMMVFLDVVYNHFGPDGNYLNRYAPAFFNADKKSPWGPAINFDGEGSRAVREFFIHNAMYWINEFRFDGLRLDAVHAISDSGSPHVLEELSRRVRESAGGRHVHLVLENEKNESAWLAPVPRPGRHDGQWNDDFHHALHVLLTGERHGYYADYAVDPRGCLAHALTHGYVFEGAGRRPGGARIDVVAGAPQWLPAMVNFACNHDQAGNRARGERLEQLVPLPAMELALLLTLLTPATPLLFFGDELAVRSPFPYFAGWEGELRHAVTEGRKREFAHAFANAADVADGAGLPDPCGESTFRSARLPRHEALPPEAHERMSLVRDALRLRAMVITPRQALLKAAGHEAECVGASGLRVRWTYQDGASLVLDINLGAGPITPAPGVPAGALDPVHAHRWSEGDGIEVRPVAWPAWAARWFLVTPETAAGQTA